MSRTLVVVTCKRDHWEFELLIRSIDKFLQPCPVIFVYNENTEHVGAWKKFYKNYCSSYLNKFDVKILTKDDFWSIDDENHLTFLEKEGHVDQQVIKLAVSKYVETDYYVLLDAKNFFIAPTSVNDIPQIKPAPTSWCEPNLKNWIVTCCETMTLSVPQRDINLTQNTTPYIMRTESARDLVNYFGGTKFLYKWFTIEARKAKHCPAEFFLYEIFTIRFGYRNLGDDTQNCVTLWEHMHSVDRWRFKNYINHIEHMQQRYAVKIAGLHKGLRPHLTRKETQLILEKLNCGDIIPDNIPFTGEKSYGNNINTNSRA
jgi:hypothetical protein